MINPKTVEEALAAIKAKAEHKATHVPDEDWNHCADCIQFEVLVSDGLFEDLGKRLLGVERLLTILLDLAKYVADAAGLATDTQGQWGDF